MYAPPHMAHMRAIACLHTGCKVKERENTFYREHIHRMLAYRLQGERASPLRIGPPRGSV